MNIGSIGKVLANQAIETTKKSVMDAVTAPDTKPKPAAVAPVAQDTGALILGQLQAMQRPLREDQELQVWLRAAHEVLRVNEIFVPNGAVLVFAGLDNQGNVTRVILPSDQTQLVCKIVAVAPGAPAKRVNIITPKPRPDAPAAGQSS